MLATGDIPIGPAMRHIRSDIRQGCPIDLENWPVLQSTDPKERMAELRPALYILGGLLAPFAVRQLMDMQSERLPQGLVVGPISWRFNYPPDAPQLRPLKPVKSFSGLYKGLQNAAQLTMNTLVIPEEYHSVATRLNQLVPEAHKLHPEDSRYTTPQHFMTAGLFTAIEMTIGAQSGISALADNERAATTQEDYLGIVNRSWRLPTATASLNIDHINPFRRAVVSNSYPHRRDYYSDETPYFNPNVLLFEGDPEGPDARVNFCKPVTKLIDPHTGKRIEDIPVANETLTCLALPADAEGNSPIKDFWRHVGRLTADAVYSTQS